MKIEGILFCKKAGQGAFLQCAETKKATGIYSEKTL